MKTLEMKKGYIRQNQMETSGIGGKTKRKQAGNHIETGKHN